MIHDSESDQVRLDEAEAKGLLGYPDILGHDVTVSADGKRERRGRVVALGPLGFDLLERVSSRHGVTTLRTFVPWTYGVVSRVVKVEQDEDQRQAEAMARERARRFTDTLRRERDSRVDPETYDGSTGPVVEATTLGVGEISRAPISIGWAPSWVVRGGCTRVTALTARRCSISWMPAERRSDAFFASCRFSYCILPAS